MTLALGLVLLGALLIYGGVTGKSITHLLLGDNTVSRTPPLSNTPTGVKGPQTLPPGQKPTVPNNPPNPGGPPGTTGPVK